jgi:hypothetical protein
MTSLSKRLAKLSTEEVWEALEGIDMNRAHMYTASCTQEGDMVYSLRPEYHLMLSLADEVGAFLETREDYNDQF